jgi:hypothetical protein
MNAVSGHRPFGVRLDFFGSSHPRFGGPPIPSNAQRARPFSVAAIFDCAS